jgi:GNAT superfamily N-acetyltransferase
MTMDRPDIRILQPGDEGALEAFLLPRLDSSMFLVGNARAAGLADRGERFEGTYAAAHHADAITGVVAHYWNGMLVLQAPAAGEPAVDLVALCRAALDASGRPLGGLIGPDDQVRAAHRAFGLTATEFKMDEAEYLYRLELDDLVVPAPLREGRVRARRVEPADVDQVVAWRAAFSAESLGDAPGPRLQAAARRSVEAAMADGHIWVLETDGPSAPPRRRLVSTSAFNTAMREAVQIGGVFTPPGLRGRGYGRAVVAGSLRDARARGVWLSILFTGQDNVPAQRAYEALGFRRVGRYRLTMLRSRKWV